MHTHTHSGTTHLVTATTLTKQQQLTIYPSMCSKTMICCLRGLYLPVVAFLAQLFLEVSQGEAVGLHHAAIRDLLTTEEVGDHELLRPKNVKKENRL